jgi:protein ImuB
LALECLAAAELVGPAVVVEPRQGQPYVVSASREALRAGIGPDTRLSTATALAASLQVFEREPERERASLESLASFALRLSSLVSLEPPEGLLLEVAGSLKLFGSLAAIKAALQEELLRRSLDFRLCVAPTATGALWSARAAGADVLRRHELAGRLGALPLAVTRWPPSVQALLRDLGVRTIGECARLPREGFTRRVGNAYLLDLDRALGRSIELRPEYRAPDSWSSRAELEEESVDSELFMQVIDELIDELVGELRKRQAQIASLDIVFEHLRRAPTVESFDLLEPTHERQRFVELIEDRLERRVLPVPAVAVRVRSGIFVPLVQREGDLFERQPLEERRKVLLERLRERFGTGAVYGLRTVAEHRPEKSWARTSDLERKRLRDTEPQSQSRPLWLLEQPVSCEPQLRRAALRLCSGPERIESGWWDEQDVGRDYYTATNDRGQKLWIFRDRHSRSWFVHGLFG